MLTTPAVIIEDDAMRSRSLIGMVLLSLLAISLAGVMAQTGGPPSPQPPAAPAPANPPAAARPAPAAEPEPKVVRWVCTDGICGGCDGQCSRGGHVAVSRRGHCACTPQAGGKLDQAIRKAFQPHQKGH